MAQKSAIRYLSAAIGAAFIWGFLTIPLKHLHTLNYAPEQILYYRVLMSFIALWIYVLLFRRKPLIHDVSVLRQMPARERRKSIWIILLTGIFITTNWFTYIYVVNNIGVKVAGFGYLICPLLTAGGGFLLLKEKLSRLKVAGISLAVISIIILSTGSVSETLWSIVVAISYAVYLLLQRLIPQFDKINTLAIQLLISIIILGPFYIHQFNGLPEQSAFWTDIIVTAVLFTIIPLLLSLYALSGLPSSTIGITIYINPVITFLVAYFYFHESFAAWQLMGYSILLASVIIFNWEMIGGALKNKEQTAAQAT
ncbi:EamA family transporter [Mucilaginibacter ginkgonis]|uniref:EamA family transporter n=1 Tax=Mucilaginibacter ginkgonis TaxID=2682091 RepID=A0A6I4I7G2_9SPHI|nr:EamA family transporter [Mucilaginibacter ginkgonis]QQL49189.1 EamA family transporter [Mucilaginibacter ginkgonis]